MKIKKITISALVIMISLLCVSHTALAGKMKLRVGYDLPPFSQPGRAIEYWAKEVMVQTEGRIIVEVYPSATIGSQKSAIDLLSSGVVDGMMISFSTHRGFFPLSNIGGLPGLGFPDTFKGHMAHADALKNLIKKYPAVANEFKDYIIIFDIINGNNILLSKSKEIRTPSEVKGLKIGGVGISLEFTKVLGAAGIFSIPPHAYQKLQTGVINVATIHFSGIKDFKLYEVAKYATNVSWGQSELPLMMSKKSWNKIPIKDQTIIMEVAEKAQKHAFQIAEEYNKIGHKNLMNHKGKLINLNKQEYALWEKQFNIVWKGWIADRKRSGVANPEAILNDWKQACYRSWNR